jgi:hypothetical protein
MSIYTEDIKRVLSEVNRFLKITLLPETLSSNAENDRKNILKLLQKLFSDYDSLAPSSGDEGSVSSYKDATSGSLDESRNTIDSSHGSEEDNYSDNIPYTTVKALTESTKIGWLERRHEYLITSSWQKRYCVLHKNIFYIFKKPENKKQQGAFFVSGYEFRESPQLVKEERKKECCFELVCPGKKSYQFLGNSKEDMLSWKEVLQTASLNQPVKDEDIDGDIYEEFKDETSQQLANVPEFGDDIYDDTVVDTSPRKQPNSPVTSTAKQSPGLSKMVPPAVEIKKKTETPTVKEEEEDDNLIYEPIDPISSPGPFSKPNTLMGRLNQSSITSASSPSPHSPKIPKGSLPSPKEIDFPPPPPVPPHRVPEPTPPPPQRGQDLPPPPPQRGQDLPPPPPPQRVQDLLPPPPPETAQISRALPPPPTDPLPAVPRKMTVPNLGKILPPSEDFENLFYGKWDCTGTTDNELTFKRGQIVHIISRDLEKDDWWVGALDDKVGLVPRNYFSPAYEQIR